ncbi:MAG: class I SAM-dependent methyltransferase [Bacteroidales bacterium]|nr:class I SAM-dependent methyltransferase [Bacteroidales bacterium]
MAKTKPFDNHLSEYELWFDDNHYVFLSELEAIKKLLPGAGKGVEIGIGSGIFSSPLGITEGCDPSPVMRKKALDRGLNAIDGVAEALPYQNDSFDFALMVTTICFVDDPQKSLEEIYRILKPGGDIIIGYVDKNSPVGELYQLHKEESLFYNEARFFSTDEIIKLLVSCGFSIIQTCQTVFGQIQEITEVQPPEDGYGEGSFVVIKAKKK